MFCRLAESGLAAAGQQGQGHEQDWLLWDKEASRLWSWINPRRGRVTVGWTVTGSSSQSCLLWSYQAAHYTGGS